MEYLAALSIIGLAGWAFTRLVALRETRREIERLKAQHDPVSIYREAGVR